MDSKELLERKATLESIHDQLWTELLYIDQLMRLVGFTDGIETVKATAQELIKTEHEEYEGLAAEDESEAA